MGVACRHCIKQRGKVEGVSQLINYKSFNKLTKKDSQPVPYIDELLHEVVEYKIVMYKIPSNFHSQRQCLVYYIHYSLGHICMTEDAFRIVQCWPDIPTRPIKKLFALYEQVHPHLF